MHAVKTLAVIAAAVLIGANAATLDVVGSTCACAPLAATTTIIADITAAPIKPTGCTFKGVVGTSYLCSFATNNTNEANSLKEVVAAPAMLRCHWDRDGYYWCEQL